MKRIALALFAIAGVVAGGYFATSAYFTDTVTQNNYTFTTSNADLKFGFCPDPVGTYCGATAATLDTIDFDLIPGSSLVTGPGKSGSSCLVIENAGSYLLHLTSKLTVVSQTAAGMQDAFLVSAAAADSSCNGTSWLYSLQSAFNAQSAGDVPIGDLAPGARMYVILGNAWDSTGNQNALQGQTLKLNTSVTGKTD